MPRGLRKREQAPIQRRTSEWRRMDTRAPLVAHAHRAMQPAAYVRPELCVGMHASVRTCSVHFADCGGKDDASARNERCVNMCASIRAVSPHAGAHLEKVEGHDARLLYELCV